MSGMLVDVFTLILNCQEAEVVPEAPLQAAGQSKWACGPALELQNVWETAGKEHGYNLLL